MTNELNTCDFHVAGARGLERRKLVEIPEWRVGYVCRRIKRLC